MPEIPLQDPSSERIRHRTAIRTRSLDGSASSSWRRLTRDVRHEYRAGRGRSPDPRERDSWVARGVLGPQYLADVRAQPAARTAS